MGSRGSKLSKEDLRFLEENTNFQRNEIKQWFKGFMVSECECVCVRVRACVCACVCASVA